MILFFPKKITNFRVLIKTVTNIRFKEIASQQLILFPSNIGDKIAANYPVRLVNQVIESLNNDNILATYLGDEPTLHGFWFYNT